MISDLPNDSGQEDKARAATLRFIADAITQPVLTEQGEYIWMPPEKAMVYLISNIANRDPDRLHRICRVAWSMMVTTQLNAWECIWGAKAALEAHEQDE